MIYCITASAHVCRCSVPVPEGRAYISPHISHTSYKRQRPNMPQPVQFHPVALRQQGSGTCVERRAWSDLRGATALGAPRRYPCTRTDHAPAAVGAAPRHSCGASRHSRGTCQGGRRRGDERLARRRAHRAGRRGGERSNAGVAWRFGADAPAGGVASGADEAPDEAWRLPAAVLAHAARDLGEARLRGAGAPA